MAGPGGDPNGDTAAWFDGDELVVYDTAAGREISRTSQAHGVAGCPGTCGDHYPAGNGFLQVSAERIVWTSESNLYSHDVRTRTTAEVEFVDVQDQVEVLGEDGHLVLRVPGRAEERYPELGSHVRLSPTGNYVLAVEETNSVMAR